MMKPHLDRVLGRVLIHAARALPGLLLALGCAAAAAADFLEPAAAFKPSLEDTAQAGAVLRFSIAPHYHLYRDRFELRDAQGQPLSPALPAGRMQFDRGEGKQMALWEGGVRIALPSPSQPGDWQLSYQGCADEGLCYPPEQLTVRWESRGGLFKASLLAVDANGPAGPAASPPAENAVAAATATAQPVDQAAEDSNRIADALHSGSVLTVMGVFLVFGLLLSFTPCVLPMLPILSSIIVGQAQPVSRWRGFTLALAYALGMALVYTLFGMLAGWLGQGLAGALQNPWVLGAFALLLAGLSLSMFGVWEFQMPGFVQQRLSSVSNRLPGGKHAGVFVMGALSALLVGPCVAAPLAGVLVYISQTRDLVLGGAALFALACGMSVPLLLLGLSAGTLLPRAGAWMERVKALFGVLLLATALWLVAPVLPGMAVMLLLGTGALMGASWLGWPLGRAPQGLARAVAVPLGLWGAALWIGALSGGDSVGKPLHHLANRVASTALAGPAPAATPTFMRVRSEAELAQALSTANGRPVLLDYYADWCVACKEMEHETFSDAGVSARMQKALLIQADVTDNSADARQLLKRFGLFGPPGIVFLDAQGEEKFPGLRVVGFMNAPTFHDRLGRAGMQ